MRKFVCPECDHVHVFQSGSRNAKAPRRISTGFACPKCGYKLTVEDVYGKKSKKRRRQKEKKEQPLPLDYKNPAWVQRRRPFPTERPLLDTAAMGMVAPADRVYLSHTPREYVFLTHAGIDSFLKMYPGWETEFDLYGIFRVVTGNSQLLTLEQGSHKIGLPPKVPRGGRLLATTRRSP